MRALIRLIQFRFRIADRKNLQTNPPSTNTVEKQGVVAPEMTSHHWGINFHTFHPEPLLEKGIKSRTTSIRAPTANFPPIIQYWSVFGGGKIAEKITDAEIPFDLVGVVFAVCKWKCSSFEATRNELII